MSQVFPLETRLSAGPVDFPSMLWEKARTIHLPD